MEHMLGLSSCGRPYVPATALGAVDGPLMLTKKFPTTIC